MTRCPLITALMVLLVSGCGSSGPGDADTTQIPDSGGPGPAQPSGAPPPPANRAPVPMDDKIVLGAAAPVDVFVLQNDTDADGDPIAIVALGTPTSGIVQWMDNGTPGDTTDDFVRFTPPVGFSGSAIFSYTVRDDADATASAIVTIQSDSSVDGQTNNAPFAQTDAVETTPGSAAIIDVLANDSDADGDTLFLLAVSAAAHGTVAIDNNGSGADTSDDLVLYTPAPGFSGSDSFRYQISDGRVVVEAGVNIAVQAITVLPPSQVCGLVMIGPVTGAQISLFALTAGGAATGAPVAQSVTDSNGQWCLTLPATRNDLLVVSTGGEYFDPADSGTATTGLRRIDISGGDLETVLFASADFAMATPLSSALVRKSRRESAGDDFAAVLAANRLSWTTAFGFDVLSTAAVNPLNPTAAAAAEQRYTMVTGGAAGAINRLAVELSLAMPAYDVAQAFVRDYSDCRLDGSEDGDPVEINIGGVATPIAAGLDFNLEILRFRNNLFDQYAGVPLAQVDEAFCAQSGEQPDRIAPVFTLLPDDLLIVDAAGAGIPIDDPAVLAFIAGAQAIDNRGADPVIELRLAGGGELPQNLVTGATLVVFVARDQAGNTTTSAPLTITVTMAAPPVAGDDTAVGNEDTALVVDILANDFSTAAGIDPASVTILSQTAGGTLSVNPLNGVVTLVPAADFFGVFTFGYTVADVSGTQSNAAIVSITINAVADDPVASPDAALTDEGAGVRIVVLANDLDADGDLDPASVEIVAPPTRGSAIVEANGDISYAPTGDLFGIDSLSYRVADSRGAFSAAADVTIDVQFVDDPPLANDDNARTLEGASFAFDLLANDSDPDTAIDPASTTIQTAPLGAAFLDPGTGIVNYTPPVGFVGEDSLSYRVDDLAGNTSAVATMTIVVWPGDDPDFDGVGNSVETAMGTDPDAADDVYVFVDSQANAAASDGTSWQSAFVDLASAAAAGRLNETPGRTTYVLMADNSAASIAGNTWTVDLNGSCDGLVFVGGLGYLISNPQLDTDGLPVTAIEAVDAGTRPVTLQDCNNLRFHSVAMRGGSDVIAGGAMLVRSAIVRMTGVHIVGNRALERGGAIALQDGGGALTAEVSIEDSLIAKNSVAMSFGGVAAGGAIFADPGTVASLSNTRLIGNRLDQVNGAPVSGGGAAVFAKDADLKVTGSTFAGNVSNTVGGAIALRGTLGVVTIESSTISGNEAQLRGGGIHLTDTGANVVVHNNLIVSNYAGLGGAVYVANGLDTRFSNNSARFNHANDGGGWLVTGTSPVFNDNIVQDNVAAASGNNIGGNVALLFTLNASNNFVDNGFAGVVGVNNTDLDPLFDVGYYLSHPASPAIDYSLTFASSDPTITLDSRYTDAGGTSTDSGALDSGYHYAAPAVAAPDLIELHIPEFGYNGVDQRIRILPNLAGVPTGPGRRVYVDAGSASITPHLFEQTGYVSDPRVTGTSTEARDLGNGYYEVLVDTDGSGSYILDVWVDDSSGLPLTRFLITIN